MSDEKKSESNKSASQVLSLLNRWKSAASGRSSFNTVFASCDGIYMQDVDGNRYMDFCASMCHVGNKNPKVVNAVLSQLKKSGVNGLRFAVHEPRLMLAEKLQQIAPKGLRSGKVAFTNTGSDASEGVMKLARAYTKKQILLAYIGAHHGHTIGSLALTADYSSVRRFCLPLVPSVVHLPYPYCYRCPFKQKYPDCNVSCLDYAETILATLAHPDEVAAVFLEPVLQLGGVVVPPKEYVMRLRRLCDEYAILLVDDEVYTGFGKTGRMFAIEHFGVTPDIMYMGKGIASGISLAAIIAKKQIMAIEDEVGMIYGGAFAGNPVSCVSALATIEVIEESRLVENSENMGRYITKRINEMAEQIELIGDVRGLGLLIGIELVKEGKKPAVAEAGKIVSEAFNQGLLIRNVGTNKNVIRLVPPLVIRKEEVDKALNLLEELFRRQN